jgi:predicted CoA-binding protein
VAEATGNEVIRAVLGAARTIAVVGASPKPHRASHGVMRFLQGKGYCCIAVIPAMPARPYIPISPRSASAWTWRTYSCRHRVLQYQ